MPVGAGIRICRSSVCIRAASAGSPSETGVNGEPGSEDGEAEEDVEAEAGVGVLNRTSRFA